MGKTTLALRLAILLRQAGVAVCGFVSEEIREHGGRVGFSVETLGGQRALLAHVNFPGPPQVGRYGVDLVAFERLVLPALQADPGACRVAIVDELGRMELASQPFRDAMGQLFGSDLAVVATVHAFAHPFTDALKARPDVETIAVTADSRDRLPGLLAARLTGRQVR